MTRGVIGTMVAASAVLVLAGCAGATADGERGSDVGTEGPWVPPRATVPAEVTASSTVLEDADGVRLCLGMILDSSPPQCDGPAVLGWEWTDVEGEASAAGTTWGDYVVRGVWDGEALTVRGPAEVPIPPPAEAVTASPGPSCPPGPPLLPEIERAVTDIVGVMERLADGCTVVVVEYDDGTLQAAIDDRFGEGSIEISSSFEPVAD